MNQPEETHPYKTLGTHLKYLREQLERSLAEVSGAVEIDERTLERIELGQERPAEDVLLLLITYFDMQDQEAVQLWELAGYDGDFPDKVKVATEIPANGKNVIMLLATDVRTLYTDGVEVSADAAGVTIQFTQAAGPNGQATPLSRVGMSYEQADKVLVALQHTILRGKYLKQPRSLPPRGSSQDVK